MLEHEAQQAELLYQYWERLHADLSATPPWNLDPDLARLARALEERLRPPEPDGAFATRLRDRLEAQASASSPNGHIAGPVQRWPRLRFPASATRWPLAGLAAAAVLILALLGAMLWTMRPQTVNAQEILEKAQATATDAAAGGVKSFVLTEVTRSRPSARAKAEAGYTGAEQLRTETTQWYEAPNRWRIEMTGTVTQPDGQEVPGRAWRLLNVSDGTDHWSYDPLHKSGQVQRLAPGLNGPGGVARFGLDASGLATVLARASKCGTPMLKGTETVAGRSAYVIDLGPPKCWASDPEVNGPSTICVDKETYFVLKAVRYSGTDGQLLSTTEVTSIQYNVPIDPARFTFTPSADAKIQDARPQPTPSANQYQQQLAQLARRVDFPLFAPRAAPSGLVPLQPRLDDVAGPQVQLSYVPSDEAGTTAMAGPTGVRITQQKASYELIDRWTQQARPATIPGGQGWLRRGIRNPDATGSESAAIVLRDGTLISVASVAVSADELIKIAGSLEPVPGSHPPLPDPTPPTLAELRRHASISVFVPTWLPAGLTPEPPVGGGQPIQSVEIRYHTSDGAVGLIVGSAWLRCCPGYAMLPSEPVALPNGLEGHLIRTPTTRYGGLTLWWQQDGTTVTLTGPAVSESDLVKIAASMSQTAELGQTELPTARPTATPLPAPGFAILRPSWLPEPLTVREQTRSLPTGGTPEVVLTFDPRPNGTPHVLLTLAELPASTRPAGVVDPQVTRETIGGHEVTIVHRGQGCVSASWTQDGLDLTLTNPYDPPGPPGAVRYSCEQLRQIIASVR